MLQILQNKLKIKFNDEKLLKNALTHSSYTNEKHEENNERLEFLGDAVLELSISDYYYLNTNFKEGTMTKKRAQCVCEEALVLYANNLGISEFLLLGKGEELNGGRTRDAILADAFEAILGAIYLDQGFLVCKKFIYDTIVPLIKEHELFNDYKSTLQEKVQSEKRTLVYQIIKEEGPQHDRTFTAICKMDGISMGTGIGKTKKEAEQNAAKKALNKMVTND